MTCRGHRSWRPTASDETLTAPIRLHPRAGPAAWHGPARIEPTQAIPGTKVDLVPASDLKPEVRARAERDLVLGYDRG
jgi:hypothetical protein